MVRSPDVRPRAAEDLRHARRDTEFHPGRRAAAAQPAHRVAARAQARERRRTGSGRPRHSGGAAHRPWDAMVGFARTILAAHDEAVSYFTGSAMRGRLRFGSADDLALTQLPQILRDFRQLYPHINLELTVNQSGADAASDVGSARPRAGETRAGRVRRSCRTAGAPGLGGAQVDGADRGRPPSPSSPISRRASAGPPRSTHSRGRGARGASRATPGR